MLKCVRECLKQQLSTSWRIWSSGNHSLSMYGSSCGIPCLILHACRECHNTFTSHSSTSSQGQGGERRTTSVCQPVRMWIYARLLYMHALCGQYKLACIRYTFAYLFICMLGYVHPCANTCACPHEACCYVGRHLLYCIARPSRPLNLKSSSSVCDNRVTKQDPKDLKVQSIVKRPNKGQLYQ